MRLAGVQNLWLFQVRTDTRSLLSSTATSCDDQFR